MLIFRWLVFLLLIPALLFRTMSAVHVETLDLRPLLAYFPAALLLLSASIAWRGFTRSSVVMALGGVFSNMVMIGITLVEVGLLGRGSAREARKLHATFVGIFLVVAHIAMIFGMLDPAVLGWNSEHVMPGGDTMPGMNH
mgnify:CR=1 FL=1